MDKEIQSVPIDTLSVHPDNPRLSFREDVVESIQRQLSGSGVFPVEHAILVRPFGGGHQIICGHQRTEAARRAGLKTIPCWVRDMDDETAFMQLVLSNAQGELSPLEIGIHALHAVPLATGGKGKKGGLSEYAEKIGQDRRNVSVYRQGAEVFKAIVNPHVDMRVFLDKAQHLAAIHKADRRAWPACVKVMLEEGWSVDDAQHWVGRVCEFQIPDEWEKVFLPYAMVIERFLSTKEFSPKTVSHLCALVEFIVSSINQNAGDLAKDLLNCFMEWLKANTGGLSWDVRQVVKQQNEIDQRIKELKGTIIAAWNHGDWEDHVDSLDEGSVNLLLTDPPYGIDFQSDYRLDRRKNRKHEKIKGDKSTEDAIQNFARMLGKFFKKLTDDAHLFCFCHWSNEALFQAAIEDSGFKVRGSIIWVKNNTGMGDPNTTFAPKHERIIHAVKGSPILFVREPDVLEASKTNGNGHPMEKPVVLLERLIKATTVEGQLVADPYAGVASTLVSAKNTNRKFWGCEIEKDHFDMGCRRLGIVQEE